MFKKQILLLVVCATVLVKFSACSTDFDVTADYKEIAVVFGIINKADPVQYVRLNKAFTSEDQSALSIAQIPDSLYFANAQVSIDEFNNGNTTNTIELVEVNAADEGIVKEDGIFTTENYKLYKTDYNFRTDRTYQLNVITDNNNLVESKNPISILGTAEIEVPTPSINSEESILDNGFLIRIIQETGAETPIYDLDLMVNYVEVTLDGQEIPKQLKFDVLSSQIVGSESSAFTQVGSNRANYRFDGDKVEQLLNYMATNIDDDANINNRRIVDFDLVLWVGSDELRAYNNLQQVQTGVTSNQIQPVYSNINNGIGLFTSRYRVAQNGYRFSPASIDYIACNPITKHLNFNLNPNNPNGNCD